METWFISDTHFNHNNIIRFAERPFRNWKQMNETLMENWNRRVRPGDLVYHLGDFGFTNRELEDTEWSLDNIFRQLNGTKVLIKGNHDKRKVLDLPWKGRFDRLRIPRWEPSEQRDWFEMTHKPEILFDNGGLVLCGHIHQQFVYQGNNLNMSVEVWDYQPVTLEEINDRVAWLRNNVYDTHTKMKIFGKHSKFNEEMRVPIP